MTAAPFMPLWVGDFMLKTGDLDARETGAYLLLLMAMWSRDGSLPADQKKLQRVAKCGREWPSVWATIGHYFDEAEGRITNRRLTEELQKVCAKREVNAHNGGLGGRAKALKDKEAHLANATVSPQQSYSESERREEIGKPISPPDGFAEFWAIVPRKVAKPAALKAYRAALKRADRQTILDGMARYAESRRGKDMQFTVHPATWLNGDRWADEAPSQKTGGDDQFGAFGKIRSVG
jgi:uncharacterized protein YdaU (DUF1376 family)